jgi:hypothetical protein
VGGALVDRCHRPRPRIASPHRTFRRSAFISHFHARPGNAKLTDGRAIELWEGTRLISCCECYAAINRHFHQLVGWSPSVDDQVLQTSGD